MERSKNLKKYKEIIFVYLIFIVGIFGHLFSPLKQLMLSLTPITLLITGLVVFYKAFVDGKNKLLLWGIITYIFTLSVEVIGVKTGLIFGDYKYGETLGVKLFEVPLIIGFNWVLVILGSISLSKYLLKDVVLTSLAASSLAVVFDIVLEPIAIKLNYWSWQNGLIPFQNYLAWFVIAFIASVFFLKLNLNFRSDISIHYFFIQLVFFIILLIFS